MPVEVRWLETGRVVYERFYGDVTTSDLKITQAAFLELLNASVERVHTVFDLRELGNFPGHSHKSATV